VPQSRGPLHDDEARAGTDRGADDGVWFLGSAVGNFIGGNVGGLFETYPLDKIFLAVAATSGLAAAMMFMSIRTIRRLMTGVH